jgi:hypothetical protein
MRRGRRCRSSRLSGKCPEPRDSRRSAEISGVPVLRYRSSPQAKSVRLMAGNADRRSGYLRACGGAFGPSASTCGSPPARSWQGRGAAPGGVKTCGLLRFATASGDTQDPRIGLSGSSRRTATDDNGRGLRRRLIGRPGRDHRPQQPRVAGSDGRSYRNRALPLQAGGPRCTAHRNMGKPLRLEPPVRTATELRCGESKSP